MLRTLRWHHRISEAGPILVKAHELVEQYGIRPYWPYTPLSTSSVPESVVPDVIAHLVACESQGRSVKHLDSNHRFSYGVGQIQAGTWSEWSQESGITGDPMNSVDAVTMMERAIPHGKLAAWSCAYLLHILPKPKKPLPVNRM